MLALALIAAAAGLSHPAAYPDGFKARCSPVEGTFVYVSPRTAPIRPPSGPASGETDLMEIVHQGGRFLVHTAGPDWDVFAADEGRWRLAVLKQEKRDLVISLTDAGRSINVYHLRYEGSNGSLTIVQTSFRGDSIDNSSLATMTCKIEMSSHR
jgi:hypothetical protein